jgi:hypothetical protein
MEKVQRDLRGEWRCDDLKSKGGHFSNLEIIATWVQ